MSAILHLLSAANFELKMQKRQKQWRAIKVFIGNADALDLPSTQSSPTITSI
jgi:hypothetical protein